MKFSKALKRCIAGTIVLCHAGLCTCDGCNRTGSLWRVKPGTEGSVSQSDLERCKSWKENANAFNGFAPYASAPLEIKQQQESLRAATAKQILNYAVTLPKKQPKQLLTFVKHSSLNSRKFQVVLLLVRNKRQN
jgi:hypothetical protein